MHRLQLKLLGLFIFLGLILWATQSVHIIRLGNPDLKLAPLGYTFRLKPLSGVVFDSSSWNLLHLGFSWNGKRIGPEWQWYENGKNFVSSFYREGVEHGAQRAWFPDGKPKYWKNFRDGIAHGEFYEWHANGSLAQFIRYEEGTEVAAKSWTSGGKPFYNYVRSADSQIGIKGDRFCSPSKKL